MLIVNREPIRSVTASPPRRVYGRTASNELILPLDIALIELIDQNGAVGEQFREIPETVSVIGAEIKTSTGIKLGTIDRYSSPSIVGLVKPIVIVAPSIDASRLKEIPLGSAPAPAGLAKGSKVLIEDINADLSLSRRSVEGEVSDISLGGSSNYFGGALNVQAYSVTFSRNLQEDSRGTRVILSTKELLGILIFTSNRGGKCDALVFPAHLI